MTLLALILLVEIRNGVLVVPTNIVDVPALLDVSQHISGLFLLLETHSPRWILSYQALVLSY